MVKINKTKARNQFNLGIDVYIIPCKMRLDNMWMPQQKINKYELLKLDDDITFDKFINGFEHYNCNNELGYYTSFYIR